MIHPNMLRVLKCKVNGNCKGKPWFVRVKHKPQRTVATSFVVTPRALRTVAIIAAKGTCPEEMRVPIRRATQKSDSSRFRVSGFGFRRLKPTFAVGFGFRVSSLETNFRCRFRVSGFVDWNPLLLSVSGFGFRFRVSGFVAWNQLSLSVSNFRCRFRDSGFGFRVLSIEANFSCPFRVSGFVGRNHL